MQCWLTPTWWKTFVVSFTAAFAGRDLTRQRPAHRKHQAVTTTAQLRDGSASPPHSKTQAQSSSSCGLGLLKAFTTYFIGFLALCPSRASRVGWTYPLQTQIARFSEAIRARSRPQCKLHLSSSTEVLNVIAGCVGLVGQDPFRLHRATLSTRLPPHVCSSSVDNIAHSFQLHRIS